MPEFFDAVDVSDRKQLQLFLSFVEEDLLAPVVARGRDPMGEVLIPEEMLPEFRDAWRELQEQEQFARLRSGMEELSEARMVSYGLSGANLKVKRSVLKRLWDRFTDLGGVGRFVKLLGGVDSLLKSILGAVAGGDAVEEFKEMLGLAAESQE